MLIRCEKCSTLYELDDKLLPPQGAPVQCSKCQFVFKAYPRAAQQPVASEPPAGQDEAANEPANEPVGELPADALAGDVQAPAEPFVRESGAVAGAPQEWAVPAAPRASRQPPPASSPAPPPPQGAGEQQFTADGRPIRKVPFPTSEAAQQGPRPLPIRGPTRGGASRLRPVVPIVVIALVAIAALAWWIVARSRRGDTQPRRPPGQSRLQAPSRGTPPGTAVIFDDLGRVASLEPSAPPPVSRTAVV